MLSITVMFEVMVWIYFQIRGLSLRNKDNASGKVLWLSSKSDF